MKGILSRSKGEDQLCYIVAGEAGSAGSVAVKPEVVTVASAKLASVESNVELDTG